MKNIIILILPLIFNQYSFAQIDTFSNEKLKKEYYNKIVLLKEKREVILNDSLVSTSDFKNIITLKTNEYNAVMEITDSIQRKRLMNERIEDLDFLTTNILNKELMSEYFRGNILDVNLYKNRIDSLNYINGLEKCVNCAIWREVKFIVLKVENNKIHTLKCVDVKYKKIGFQRKKLREQNINSFPCSKTLILSLNGNYGQNIVEVIYNKRKYRREFTIGVGKSENDVYELQFVLDENYLVHD